ncbi:MAG: restriction endonuclease [Candidatus Obscuribacterales bacterium]
MPISTTPVSQLIVPFDGLGQTDLVVDALYKGGNRGNAGDDPISKLLGCGNQGGFRFTRLSSGQYGPVCLYSSLDDPDWPDFVDTAYGTFTYYGDNKKGGHQLHETHKRGNKLLKDCFSAVHENHRLLVPPFFIFTKGDTGRDVVFRGLAVPGSPGMSSLEDLIAIWKCSAGVRFQNYKATITILDEAVIARSWISDINAGRTISDQCPKAFKDWALRGVYRPLQAPPTVAYRTKNQQLPASQIERDLISLVYEHFQADPYDFERCAAALVQMMDRNVVSCDLTRRWMDGGRDALGLYRIGLPNNSITVEFALEAKCYDLGNGVGVEKTTRLVSRLRHRQFGVFVTTSYVSKQAYEEIVQDGHPIIVLSATDIAKLLIAHGYGTPDALTAWLQCI